ncbi:MAG: metallophosphoesterase [Deltaproteobacteria bacterium]|jgi:UDP-2,3-diacylglucosamine pyrophosphatase LpxH|nr:metallophosphoesterase [Deltaproteobacteria bacterium]
MDMFTWARPKPLEITHRISADQRIYIVSDLHLGDGTRSDIFLGKDRELMRFLEQVREEGAHLVIAGDAVDFHQAFSMSRVLKAHARLMGELCSLAESNGVTYLWGNHDYDISLFKDLLRFEVCSSLLIGDEVLVQHGYQYDPHIGPNLDQTHVHTMGHHMVERVLKTWIRLPIENFYTRANRMAFWTFHKWANLVDLADRMWTALGQPEAMRGLQTMVYYWTQNQIGDAGMLYDGVSRGLPLLPYQVLITGHSHLPGVVALPTGQRYVNTGSWTFSSAQYALWDHGALCVRDWLTGREYTDGAYRHLAEGRAAHMNFREWWRENYLGWLRFRGGEEGRIAPVDPAEGEPSLGRGAAPA